MEPPSPSMAQFIARVYRSPGGYRVVVDGMTHFDVERLEQTEPAAREAIETRLRAFLPIRAPPDPDPEAVSILLFEVAVVRGDSPGVHRTPRTESLDRSTPAVRPPPSRGGRPSLHRRAAVGKGRPDGSRARTGAGTR